MGTTATTENLIPNNEVTFKKTTKDLALQEVTTELEQLGFIQIEGNYNDEAQIYRNETGVIAVVPSQSWRRKIYFGDNGKITEARPGNPGRVIKSEVGVIAIQSFKRDEDKQIAIDYLNSYLFNGGAYAGPEIELTFQPFFTDLDDLSVLPEGKQELGRYQIELQEPSPYSGGDFLSR
ncbi:hypothetical protein JW796_03530 [Candidatus Dojkabacteria bacterium]|nr:hypothetical protein [Candidatus Dojkabacteria bacterium]